LQTRSQGRRRGDAFAALPQNLETRRPFGAARVSTASHNLRKTIPQQGRAGKNRDHSKAWVSACPPDAIRGGRKATVASELGLPLDFPCVA